jgi:hypothetical protein
MPSFKLMFKQKAFIQPNLTTNNDMSITFRGLIPRQTFSLLIFYIY